ncbi:MAG TPA: MEMO1 family protein [Dehalococcoidales bacterium]|nr:MEMO1 family protein [Dehalococcoidales bacterium]
MKRQAVVAGQFYPHAPSELKSMIKKMLEPGAVKEDVIGYYAPHAGFIYSGSVVGAVVSRVRLPDTFIILGPNHTGLGVPYSIMTEGTWVTPLGEVAIDTDLAKRILAHAEILKNDIAAHSQEHCIEVQLPFIQYLKKDFQFVPIVLSHASAEVYKEIGKAIANSIKESGKSVMIVASGDMTHYETEQAAWDKDMRAIDAMLKLDAEELLSRVQRYDISMCGYGSAAVLIYAALEMGAKEAELVKYTNSGETSGDKLSVVGYAGVIFKSYRESPQVKLARETVETYVTKHTIPEVKDVPQEMRGKAGVFVSIHAGDNLRGCIGTIGPTKNNIAEEIIHNAISSATRDPRFPPISKNELSGLNYSVDVLMPPEPVESEKELDPKKYGAIVESGWRRGLLLPALEGVDTVAHQIEICRAKAGIEYNEPVKLYRFEVKRYK